MKAAVATKFVKWEVPTLENLHECKVYRLRMKVNNGEVLNREEKNWITEKVNGNTYFKSAIPLQGWRFDFSDILRTFLDKPVRTMERIQGYGQDGTPQDIVRKN